MTRLLKITCVLAVSAALSVGAVRLFDPSGQGAAGLIGEATEAGRGVMRTVGLDTGGRTAPAIVYDTTAVSRGVIRKIVSTSGPVRALVTVSVGSQLSGQIHELKVDFNSEVKAGDELAVIDDKTFAAKVAQAKADLAAGRAMLATQQAGLKKSQAVLKQAERTVGRQETLAAKGIAAPAALDTATRDADVARAEIVVAEAQIENAKAILAQRQAQLDQAQIDLDRTRVRSPIDGTVIARTVDIGQTVAASLQAPELFKIAQDLRRIRIEAQVNEADVGAVADGNPATFAVDAYPERKFEGKVTQVRLAATELQNVVTYTVIIEAANGDRRLFPGMTANVQIETDKRDGALRVSNDAVRFKPRDRAARAEGGDGARAERSDRMLDRLKEELQLTDAQAGTVRQEMGKFFAEARAQSSDKGHRAPSFTPAAPSSGGELSGMRQRMTARLEQILTPLLGEAQRPLFDRWKRGRENMRSAALWVLNGTGELESRFVRLGIVDDQFTEIAGGQLKEGERVVVRAREAKK
ncbi:MAG: efflux RND transporter periplasmic adaptor subunit [Hyphomicrobiaceae bacterium]